MFFFVFFFAEFFKCHQLRRDDEQSDALRWPRGAFCSAAAAATAGMCAAAESQKQDVLCLSCSAVVFELKNIL